MQEFTLGRVSESRSVPGGRQLVGQTSKFLSPSGYRSNIHPLPCCIITQPWGWKSSTIPRWVEGRVNVDTAVSVQSMSKQWFLWKTICLQCGFNPGNSHYHS